MRTLIASLILTLSLASSSAFAASPPEGTKLSQVIAKVEQLADVHYIDDIEWNDLGYYKVEYLSKSGAEVKMKIDPKSGDIVR